jgi:hypothetical protein
VIDDVGMVGKFRSREDRGMEPSMPRLTDHVEDIAGRLSNILTALTALEAAQASGIPCDVTTLRAPLERTLAHVEGLLAEIRRKSEC